MCEYFTEKVFPQPYYSPNGTPPKNVLPFNYISQVSAPRPKKKKKKNLQRRESSSTNL